MKIKTDCASLLKVARPERSDDDTCVLTSAKSGHDGIVAMRKFLAGPKEVLQEIFSSRATLMSSTAALTNESAQRSKQQLAL